MNNVSRIKIVLGYTLLLGALLYTLFFVRREMDVLLQTAEADVQWTDSLFALLEEKDRNTRKLLYTLSQTNDSMISASDIERVIAIEDSIFTRQRVQRRIIVHKDTVVTPPKKKTFFRRLAEAFVPSKRDSAVSVKTTREVAMDTVLEAYNPADSLQRILRAVAKERRSESVAAQRRKNALQRRNRQIIFYDSKAEPISNFVISATVDQKDMERMSINEAKAALSVCSKRRRVPLFNTPTAIESVPNDALIVVGDLDGRVEIFEIIVTRGFKIGMKYQRHKVVKLHHGAVTQISYVRQLETFVSSGLDGKVCLWTYNKKFNELNEIASFVDLFGFP